MAATTEAVKLEVELTPTAAMALAQLCKRVGFSDARSNAVSEAEAYEMLAALRRVREGLAREGFSPR